MSLVDELAPLLCQFGELCDVLHAPDATVRRLARRALLSDDAEPERALQALDRALDQPQLVSRDTWLEWCARTRACVCV